MRIGLTTGVYDLLHHGHRILFARCREHCDYLIVAVASDWLVRVQKGPTRPVQDEASRTAAVRACAYVGRALVTDRLDFGDLAGMIDIIILGGDQMNVRAGVIETVRLPRTPGVSTSQIIAEGASRAGSAV